MMQKVTKPWDRVPHCPLGCDVPLWRGFMHLCQRHGLCKAFLGFTVIKSAKRLPPRNNHNSYHLLNAPVRGLAESFM